MSNTPTPPASRAGSANDAACPNCGHLLHVFATPELREVSRVICVYGATKGSTLLPGATPPPGMPADVAANKSGSVLGWMLEHGWRVAAIFPNTALWLLIPPPKTEGSPS